MKTLVIIKKNKILYFTVISFLLHFLLLCFINSKLFKNITNKKINNELHDNIVNGVMIDLSSYLKKIKQQKEHDVNHDDLIKPNNNDDSKKTRYIQNNKKNHETSIKSISKKIDSKIHTNELNLKKTFINTKNNKHVNTSIKHKNTLISSKKDKKNNKIDDNFKKNIQSIDSLLNNLTLNSVNKNNNVIKKSSINKISESSDVIHYINQIKNMIENKFFNSHRYSGQFCIINIKFNHTNNIIASLKNKYYFYTKNKELCDEAMKIISLISIPQPFNNKKIIDILKINGIDILFNPS